MSFQAFESGVNVVGYLKNKRAYMMTCAWAMMVDYDRFGLLIGSQSVTGNNLEVGQLIGVSGLNENQKEIALKIGDGHSDQIDKLSGVPAYQKGDAILIKEATTQMVVKVEEILYLDKESLDRFVIVRLVEKEVAKVPFLKNSVFK